VKRKKVKRSNEGKGQGKRTDLMATAVATGLPTISTPSSAVTASRKNVVVSIMRRTVETYLQAW
jgi:hypothetical protein